MHKESKQAQLMQFLQGGHTGAIPGWLGTLASLASTSAQASKQPKQGIQPSSPLAPNIFKLSWQNYSSMPPYAPHDAEHYNQLATRPASTIEEKVVAPCFGTIVGFIFGPRSGPWKYVKGLGLGLPGLAWA